MEQDGGKDLTGDRGGETEIRIYYIKIIFIKKKKQYYLWVSVISYPKGLRGCSDHPNMDSTARSSSEAEFSVLTICRATYAAGIAFTGGLLWLLIGRSITREPIDFPKQNIFSHHSLGSGKIRIWIASFYFFVEDHLALHSSGKAGTWTHSEGLKALEGT